MRRDARRILWERGQNRELIFYGELGSELDVNIRHPDFFTMLDTLCREESEAGGPMITALVANKRTGIPGQRFFVLAEELGHEFVSLREFVEAERETVFDWMREHPERASLG